MSNDASNQDQSSTYEYLKIESWLVAAPAAASIWVLTRIILPGETISGWIGGGTLVAAVILIPVGYIWIQQDIRELEGELYFRGLVYLTGVLLVSLLLVSGAILYDEVSDVQNQVKDFEVAKDVVEEKHSRAFERTSCEQNPHCTYLPPADPADLIEPKGEWIEVTVQ